MRLTKQAQAPTKRRNREDETGANALPIGYKNRWSGNDFVPCVPRAREKTTMKKLQLTAVAVATLLISFSLYHGLRAGVASFLLHEARVELGSGNPEQGMRLLERAHGWDSSHHEINLLLALRSLANGDDQRGSKLLEEIHATGKATVESTDALARWAEERGDSERARALYEAAAQSQPPHVAIALGLARLPHGNRASLDAMIDESGTSQPAVRTASVRGVSLFHLEDDLGLRGYGTPSAAQSMLHAKRIGATAIAVRVPGRQASVNDPTITFGDEPPGGERDEVIVRAIRDAHLLGLKVMLKPHIMLGRITDDEWRGTIQFEDEKLREQWWTSYRSFIEHYATLAARENVAIFCIGVELRGMVTQSPNEWSTLISRLRAIYPGELTYAANWYHEFEEVSFWAALDLIGIQFFFPITDVENPNSEELSAGLSGPLVALQDLVEFHGRAVLFTEVGYKSTNGAVREPWVWPQPNSSTNPALQARAYRAVIDEFEGQPWFRGLFWWNWLTDPNPGQKFAHDFTPQGKLAQDVLHELWAEDASQ